MSNPKKSGILLGIIRRFAAVTEQPDVQVNAKISVLLGSLRRNGASDDGSEHVRQIVQKISNARPDRNGCFTRAHPRLIDHSRPEASGPQALLYRLGPGTVGAVHPLNAHVSDRRRIPHARPKSMKRGCARFTRDAVPASPRVSVTTPGASPGVSVRCAEVERGRAVRCFLVLRLTLIGPG
jgi:hypothetical protein